MRSSHRPVLVGLICAGVAFAAGCRSTCPDDLLECRARLGDIQDQQARLRGELADLQQQLDVSRQQITRLQNLPEDKSGLLVKTQKIELEGLTGAYDDDKDGYDDGVVVYLQPIDRAGDVIKAAGGISIRLVDLSGDEPVVVGQIDVPPEESLELWYGRLLTNHFTVRCPFSQPPRGREVTVDVQFVELLTGRRFTAQKTVEVNGGPSAARTQPVG